MPTVPKHDHAGRVPEPKHTPRFRVRDAFVAMGVTCALLVLFAGGAVKRWGEQMSPGVPRDVVLAVGRPTAWIASRLPFQHLGHELTASLSAQSDLSHAGGGFGTPLRAARAGVPPVTPDAFDPSAIGSKPRRPPPLKTVLVTGDSMAMPLDVDLAQRLAGKAKVVRDPHVGTGISKSVLVDWGKLSTDQVQKHHPQAVVVFIGANEGFSMTVAGTHHQVVCCGPDWAAEYANRVRRMMNTYRQNGAARVYWLTLPAPRDHLRAKVAKVVNAAIGVAASAYGAQVRVLDMSAIFTPGGHYRDAMSIHGRQQIVRQPDGIHLNDPGSSLAADDMLAAIRRDFGG